MNKKLTNEQVQEIRDSKEPLKTLAEKYGVSKDSVSSIHSGRRRNLDHTYFSISSYDSKRKLTNKQVQEIRDSNEPLKVLAKRYGVSRGHIGSVKIGRRRNPYNIYVPIKNRLVTVTEEISNEEQRTP